MFHIVLYQPEIAPNTGNIIRLCANTGAMLHLIHPLGFSWSDKKLRRSGLDYHEHTSVKHHDSWKDFCLEHPEGRIWILSTKAQQRYDHAQFLAGDILLFGSETSGLPPEVQNSISPSQQARLPMRASQRSLNLSNSVAIVLYEALRQNDFTDLA